MPRRTWKARSTSRAISSPRMQVANALEEIRLSLGDRLRLFVALWRD